MITWCTWLSGQFPMSLGCQRSFVDFTQWLWHSSNPLFLYWELQNWLKTFSQSGPKLCRTDWRHSHKVGLSYVKSAPYGDKLMETVCTLAVQSFSIHVMVGKMRRIVDKSPTPFQGWQKWGGVFTNLPPPGEGWRKCEGVFTSLRPPGWPDRACCGGGWCIRWWAHGHCPTCRGHTANTAPPGCRESPPCCGTGAASLVPVETTGISMQALVSKNAVTASMHACSATSAYL